MRLKVEALFSKAALEILRARKADFFIGTTMDVVGNDLQFHSIGDFEVMLAMPEDHPLAGHDVVSAKMVEGYPMIMPSADTNTRYLWDLYAMRHGVKSNVMIEVGTNWIVKKFIQSGLGISVLPSRYVGQSDRVSLIPFAEPFPKLSYGVITNQDPILSAAARQFVMMVVSDAPATA